MFEWIFYPWMISNAYTLLIIYARVYITPIYIYSMLVLFIDCWGSNLSIQAGVGKLNGDLLQPSGIRYKFWSFSVRYLISLAYWKGLISGVKLSIVIPQAIGISLRYSHRNNVFQARIMPFIGDCCTADEQVVDKSMKVFSLIVIAPKLKDIQKKL